MEDPALVPLLWEAVEDHTAGSPIDPDQLWTNRSPAELADEINDTIWANSRDNVLRGGSGDDWLFGGIGINTITDGSGHDYVDFAQNQAAVSFHASSGNVSAQSDRWGCLTGPQRRVFERLEQMWYVIDQSTNILGNKVDDQAAAAKLLGLPADASEDDIRAEIKRQRSEGLELTKQLST